MNYSKIGRHIALVVFILGIQIFVLQRVDLTFGDFKYIHLFIYPYLVMTLPFNFNKYFLLIYAFCIGMIVDVFLGTYGIHAASLLLMGMMRPTIYRLFEPREGYSAGEQPSVSKQGLTWVLTTASILILTFCLFLFSVEAFSFVYLSEILLRSIFSFLGSIILIFLTFILFNSKG
jgi:hypothetical protein